MWCRLVKDEKAQAAAAIQWKQSGKAAGAASAPSAAVDSVRPLYIANLPEDPEIIAIREAERRIAEAYQRGLKEGEAAAAARLTAAVNAKIEQLGRAIEQMATHRIKIQREAEPELVRLALAIARRILRRELSVDPESLQGLLKAGLEKIEAAEVHRVRVHPEHAGVMRGLLAGAARPVEV